MDGWLKNIYLLSGGTMTLMPCLDAEVKVYEGPVVELGPEAICAHPDCAIRYALHTHHVVRRTATGGPARWVVVNGVILLNERKLCWAHHAMVTGGIGGHRAWIRYLEGEGWVWYAPTPMAALSPSAVTDKMGAVWLPVGRLKEVS